MDEAPAQGRTERLAAWLERLAEKEAFTAKVLAGFPAGDPSECETRARLFREIAAVLRRGRPA